MGLNSNNGGNVASPATSTDNAIVRFDGATGKAIQSSAVSITDLGGIVFPALSGQTHQAGKVVFDSDNDCLTFYNSEADVANQIGQETWIRVRNVSGSTITNGSAVYISGASSGLPTIALAQSNSATTTRGVYCTTHDIENNTVGFVTAVGVVRDLNTNAWAPGTVLFLSSSVAGGLTSTAPAYPNYELRVGFVAVQDVAVGTIVWTAGTALLDNARNSRILSRNYTPATGTNTTNEELLHSLQVAASLIEVNDIINIYSSAVTNSSAGTKTFRMYINTSNSLSGATQIAQSTGLTSASTAVPFAREFVVISNTSLECYAGATGAANSQYSTSAAGVSANATVPSLSAGFWILISGQKTTGTDTDAIRWTKITLSKT